jgi:hypothetical protein
VNRTDFIRALDRAERAAWTSKLDAVPEERREAMGLAATRKGDVIALSCTSADYLLFNRAIGLGVERPATPTDVEAVQSHFAARGIARYMIHADAEDEALARLLQSTLVKYPRSWDKLSRPVDPLPDAPARSVERALPSEAPGVAALFNEAFGVPSALELAYETLLRAHGWEVYVIRDGTDVVAASALFIDGDIGYLAGAAVAKAHRGKGAQQSMIAARIRRSAELGCRFVSSETGQPVVGEPNVSYQNLRRAGFEPLHTRDNWVPAGTGRQKLGGA